VLALRLLVRASPLLLGAAAAAIWLRRVRKRERQALPAPAETAQAAPDDGPVQRAGRFDRESTEGDWPAIGGFDPPPSGRLEPEPADIVTVVDDLLDAEKR